MEGPAQKRSNRAQALRQHEQEDVLFFSWSWKCYPPLEGKQYAWKADFQGTQVYSRIKNVYWRKWMTCFSSFYSRHISGLDCKNIKGTYYFTSVLYRYDSDLSFIGIWHTQNVKVLDPWKSDHYIVTKSQELITHWHCIICQRNGNLKM